MSDTSLVVDRSVKVPMYARAGVEEVWIVSFRERAVHVHAEPEPAATRYRRVRTLTAGDRLRAERMGIEIAVDDVLQAGA